LEFLFQRRRTVEAPAVAPILSSQRGGDKTMASIIDIEGVGEVFAGKLKAAGVATVEALLATAASAKGREDLAAKSGISTAKLLEWVNRADLYRIKGVASEYSDLLEAAGVDSPAELAHRVAANLFQKITEINTAKKLVRKMPTEKQVADWIAQAKKLPKLVTH
jgi:predicted flap endonuclease-1-like 5' DNA nuclease